jgi:hypothetical protein
MPLQMDAMPATRGGTIKTEYERVEEHDYILSQAHHAHERQNGDSGRRASPVRGVQNNEEHKIETIQNATQYNRKILKKK